jgi:hypothetical protein
MDACRAQLPRWAPLCAALGAHATHATPLITDALAQDLCAAFDVATANEARLSPSDSHALQKLLLRAAVAVAAAAGSTGAVVTLTAAVVAALKADNADRAHQTAMAVALLDWMHAISDEPTFRRTVGAVYAHLCDLIAVAGTHAGPALGASLAAVFRRIPVLTA